MDQKLIKRMLIVTLVFAFISLGNVGRMKDLDAIRAVDVVSLVTCGVGIGAFLVTLIMFVRSRNSK